MARLGNFSTMAIFFAVYSVLMASSTLADASSPTLSPAPAPATEEDQSYLDSISPKERTLLEDCAEKLDPECGDEVVNGMFDKTTISGTCCSQLVKMGRTCEKHLVALIANSPEYMASEAQIMSNAEEAWNQCAAALKPSSPPPSPF
ncbi:protein DOWN-REGULATED IN DIF1 11-like [Diospyros lotus]|uniref:protein DOWN-REGULATED IN DIF1 11-like n=1 Tax=Diospyros lotus TaxID=55363 RepID=UPI00224E0206|nr:protein DOWN-REGULATED IN DIF1 11-like [Diospyros lotus]